MKDSKMADNVFAALVSCFFSCVFFFGFGCFAIPFPANCFGMILALSGILTSCMWDVLLVSAWCPAGCRLSSESPLVGRKCGLVLVGGDSSVIILIVGRSVSASGSLIRIVYTESADADLGAGEVVALILVLGGSERLSRAAGMLEGGSYERRSGDVPPSPPDPLDPPRTA